MATHRVVAFVTVAALGFGVQACAIAVLTSCAGTPVAIATAIGVLLAVVHNFAWHDRWTWSDRTTGVSAIARLAKFTASVGIVSLVGTVALTTLYVVAFRVPLVLGNLLAVWSTALLNYFVLDRLVFGELQS
jgi:putative flippase GtrA